MCRPLHHHHPHRLHSAGPAKRSKFFGAGLSVADIRPFRKTDIAFACGNSFRTIIGGAFVTPRVHPGLTYPVTGPRFPHSGRVVPQFPTCPGSPRMRGNLSRYCIASARCLCRRLLPRASPSAGRALRFASLESSVAARCRSPLVAIPGQSPRRRP